MMKAIEDSQIKRAIHILKKVGHGYLYGPDREVSEAFVLAIEALRALATHEEREGEDRGLVASLERHLEDLEYEATGPRFGPATNGFAYAKIPDWLLRQVISALRPHTDREPDAVTLKGALEIRNEMQITIYAPGTPPYEEWRSVGKAWVPVYIGPPVQPEEEEG